jgi:hypothetical protein
MISTLRLSALAVLGITSAGLAIALPASAQISAQLNSHRIAQLPVQPANPTPVQANPAPEPAVPAATPTAAPTAAPTAEPLVEPDGGPTTNYSDGAVSIDYPTDWTIEVADDSLKIANLPESETDLVSTQVFQIASPPGPLVDANIDSFIEEGAAVDLYRTVTIDGQSALVMWLSERPGTLSQAIATFIGYGDKTVLLFSQYSPENSEAEGNILRLHTSFSNLAAAPEGTEAPGGTEGTEVTEDPAEESVEGSAEESVEAEAASETAPETIRERLSEDTDKSSSRLQQRRLWGDR